MLMITMGEPHSVNTRAVAYCLDMIKSLQAKVPVVIVGSYFQWTNQLKLFGNIPMRGSKTENISLPPLQLVHELPKQPGLFFWDIKAFEKTSDLLSDAECGDLALKALSCVPRQAADLAVITCPVDKKKISLCQPGFVGQTEFFADLWQGETVMLLAGPKLRVALATNHLALEHVPKAITVPLLHQKTELLAKTLLEILGLETPHIAVCGLNPHCGDRGLFGHEDQEIIAKFVSHWDGKARLTGPLPADTVFHFAHQGKFDAVLAMYHDQGLGPLKALHFDEAVNISGGLKHLRVSPDHGPAADLIESPDFSVKSFRAAFQTAINYLEKRFYVG